MTALATVDQVESRLGRTLTAAEETRLAVLIDDASAAVRAYTGQQITLVEDDTVRLKVIGGKVHLPQHPVIAVSAVDSVTGTALSFTWHGGPLVALSTVNAFDVDAFTACATYVDVTYDHGYSTIPADIVAVVAQMAGRALGTTPGEGGVQSESIGGYNYSIGAAAAAGGIGMLPAERAVLDRYKLPVGAIRMERV